MLIMKHLNPLKQKRHTNKTARQKDDFKNKITELPLTLIQDHNLDKFVCFEKLKEVGSFIQYAFQTKGSSVLSCIS